MQRKNHFSYLVSRIAYIVLCLMLSFLRKQESITYPSSSIRFFTVLQQNSPPLLAFACPVEKIRRRLFFSPTRLILRRKIAQNSQKVLANRVAFPLELYLGETLLGGFQNEDCDSCFSLPALGHSLPGGSNHRRWRSGSKLTG